nr:mediator of RNA polymerase II transcription subunit 12 [Ipomoea batatas]
MSSPNLQVSITPRSSSDLFSSTHSGHLSLPCPMFLRRSSTHTLSACSQDSSLGLTPSYLLRWAILALASLAAWRDYAPRNPAATRLAHASHQGKFCKSVIQLGPPDYHPQTLNCPEDTLNRDYVQSDYRETVDGLRQSENATEQSMSLGLKNGRLGKYMEYRLKVHNWLRLGSFLIKGHVGKSLEVFLTRVDSLRQNVPGVTDLGLAPRQIKKVGILVGGALDYESFRDVDMVIETVAAAPVVSPNITGAAGGWPGSLRMHVMQKRRVLFMNRVKDLAPKN